MKKFVLLVSVIVLLYIVGDYLYYREGVYIDVSRWFCVCTLANKPSRSSVVCYHLHFLLFLIHHVNIYVADLVLFCVFRIYPVKRHKPLTFQLFKWPEPEYRPFFILK